MTKLNEQRFTRKQADRILADAAERESRDYGTELGEGLTYTQIVKSAEEAGIDPKYLKRSAKDLIKEAGGLEKAAVGRMGKKVGKLFNILGSNLRTSIESYFTSPSTIRKLFGKEDGEFCFVGALLGAGSYAMTLTTLLTFPESKDFYSLPENAQPYIATLAAISTATQIASGLYEWYKYEKGKLVEEMNGEDKK